MTQRVGGNNELFCRSLLFDLDGTLVDSASAIAAAWRRWARENHIPQPELEQALGGTTRSTLASLVGPDLADTQLPGLMAYEIEESASVRQVKGARMLLDSLPDGAWGIITSSSRPVALARLLAAHLPVPRLLCTAEDYPESKPDPSPYLVGLDMFGFAADDCVTFEDSGTGVSSAAAAGVRVVGVCTYTQPTGPVMALARDLTDVTLLARATGFTVLVRDRT